MNKIERMAEISKTQSLNKAQIKIMEMFDKAFSLDEAYAENERRDKEAMEDKRKDK